MDALMHSMSSEASERLTVDVDGGKGIRLEGDWRIDTLAGQKRFST